MGKSTVAEMFKELGAEIIDADRIVRELLEEQEVISEIKKAFGEDIIQKTGDRGQKTEDTCLRAMHRQGEQKTEINKKMLAEIVFEHPHLRISLEDILHPRVFDKIDKEIKKLPEDSIVIVEAPVIFERGYQNRFDRIITVFTDEDTAVSRLKEKGIPAEDARKRLKSQFSVEMKISKSDYAIDNSKDIESTRRQVEEIYKAIVNSQ
jgi:dephospho-CoA kinase